MKAILLKGIRRVSKGALFALSALLFVSCDLDLVNPNSATEAQVLKTKEGLFGLAVGMENYYATRALGSVITNIAVTAREAAAVTTYSSLENLEDGGPELAGDNERVSRTFSRLYRVKGMAEDIIANVDDLPVSEGTKNGLFALASLYRAMCLGNLAQNWEYVAIVNDRNGQASYSPRQEAFEEAVRILEASIQRIESKRPSTPPKRWISPKPISSPTTAKTKIQSTCASWKISSSSPRATTQDFPMSWHPIPMMDDWLSTLSKHQRKASWASPSTAWSAPSLRP